jgi:hypothetical protein
VHIYRLFGERGSVSHLLQAGLSKQAWKMGLTSRSCTGLEARRSQTRAQPMGVRHRREKKET